MQLLLKYDSELALHRSCCRSSKQDDSVSSGTWHGWAIRKHVQSPIYVDSRVTQGLEAPPRTSTSHLATDHGSRPPAAQSRSKLSLSHDSLRTENNGSNSWKRLRSSQGHARDDDGESVDGLRISVSYFATLTMPLAVSLSSVVIPLNTVSSVEPNSDCQNAAEAAGLLPTSWL